MRILSKLGHLFMPLVLISALAACEVATGKQTAGQYVDDTTITTKVKAELLEDPTLEKMQIEVETFQQVVQLSGFVDKPATKMRAEQVAESVEGVKDVENDLIVR